MAKGYYKTKEQRRLWWKELSPEDKEAYIAKKQKEKAPRIRFYNEGLALTGVNEGNKAEWKALILKKNPWLKKKPKDMLLQM